MTDEQLHDPELAPYYDAYRAAEPRRRRDPFADRRLATVAAGRANRHASPLRRFLATSPLAPLAPALLAAGLLLAPLQPSAPAPVVMELATPAVTVMTAPASGVTRSDTTGGTTAVDPRGIAALAVAAAGVALALRRLRRRA